MGTSSPGLGAPPAGAYLRERVQLAAVHAHSHEPANFNDNARHLITLGTALVADFRFVVSSSRTALIRASIRLRMTESEPITSYGFSGAAHRSLIDSGPRDGATWRRMTSGRAIARLCSVPRRRDSRATST